MFFRDLIDVIRRRASQADLDLSLLLAEEGPRRSKKNWFGHFRGPAGTQPGLYLAWHVSVVGVGELLRVAKSASGGFSFQDPQSLLVPGVDFFTDTPTFVARRDRGVDFYWRLGGGSFQSAVFDKDGLNAWGGITTAYTPDGSFGDVQPGGISRTAKSTERPHAFRRADWTQRALTWHETWTDFGNWLGPTPTIDVDNHTYSWVLKCSGAYHCLDLSSPCFCHNIPFRRYRVEDNVEGYVSFSDQTADGSIGTVLPTDAVVTGVQITADVTKTTQTYSINEGSSCSGDPCSGSPFEHNCQDNCFFDPFFGLVCPDPWPQGCVGGPLGTNGVCPSGIDPGVSHSTDATPLTIRLKKSNGSLSSTKTLQTGSHVYGGSGDKWGFGGITDVEMAGMLAQVAGRLSGGSGCWIADNGGDTGVLLCGYGATPVGPPTGGPFTPVLHAAITEVKVFWTRARSRVMLSLLDEAGALISPAAITTPLYVNVSPGTLLGRHDPSGATVVSWDDAGQGKRVVGGGGISSFSESDQNDIDAQFYQGYSAGRRESDTLFHAAAGSTWSSSVHQILHRRRNGTAINETIDLATAERPPDESFPHALFLDILSSLFMSGDAALFALRTQKEGGSSPPTPRDLWLVMGRSGAVFWDVIHAGSDPGAILILNPVDFNLSVS